jgi:hypothetical protein
VVDALALEGVPEIRVVLNGAEIHAAEMKGAVERFWGREGEAVAGRAPALAAALRVGRRRERDERGENDRRQAPAESASKGGDPRRRVRA